MSGGRNNHSHHRSRPVNVFESLSLPPLQGKGIEYYVEGLKQSEAERRRNIRLLNYNETEPTTKRHENVLGNYFDLLDEKLSRHPLLSNPSTLRRLKQNICDVYSRQSILFSVDVELYEFQQSIVTEIGVSIYDPTCQDGAICPYVRNIHLIIKEYENLRNGRFVSDNKDKFLGGESLVLPAYEAAVLLQLLINHYFVILPRKFKLKTFLTGHGIKGDLKWLEQIGIDLPDNCQILDCQTIWAATHGTQKNSLSRILSFLNIPHSYLHNAGNDAYYTCLLCLNLCDPYTRLNNHLDDYEPEVVDEEAVGTGYKTVGKSRRHRKTFEFKDKVEFVHAPDAIAHIYKRKNF